MSFFFPTELIIGGVGILLLLEATRRAIGIPLVIVASIFLIYSIFGQNMPLIISHQGLSLTRLVGYQLVWWGSYFWNTNICFCELCFFICSFWILC